MDKNTNRSKNQTRPQFLHKSARLKTSGLSKTRKKSTFWINTFMFHTIRDIDIVGHPIALLPALGFRSGRCVEPHTPLGSKSKSWQMGNFWPKNIAKARGACNTWKTFTTWITWITWTTWRAKYSQTEYSRVQSSTAQYSLVQLTTCNSPVPLSEDQ